MTKEDYMRLPKERLAELLVEKETQRFAYMQIHPLCYEPGGTCTNPFHALERAKHWDGHTDKDVIRLMSL